MSLAEKIRDMLPEGARPRPCAYQLVSDEFVEDSPDAIKSASGRILQQLPDPCRIVVLDTADLDPWQDGDYLPDAVVFTGQAGKIIYGITIGAIPGRLPYIVVRGRAGTYEGNWLDRKAVSHQSLHLIIEDEEPDTYRQVLAEATGEVEIRADGLQRAHEPETVRAPP